MTTEPHRLQQDPPEGDRDLIDRELARQDKKQQNDTAKDQLSGQEKTPGEGPSSDRRAAAQLREGAEADAGSPSQSASGRSDNQRAMDDAAPQTGVRPGP